VVPPLVLADGDQSPSPTASRTGAFAAGGRARAKTAWGAEPNRSWIRAGASEADGGLALLLAYHYFKGGLAGDELVTAWLGPLRRAFANKLYVDEFYDRVPELGANQRPRG
jgi:hypothetical protein